MLIIGAVILALAAAAATAPAVPRQVERKPAHRNPPRGGAEVYRALRKLALGMKPKDIGLETSPGAIRPYGILMETGYPKAVVTLTSFSSGDASLYFSTGGGVIGGVGHETVRTAARQFVAAAQQFLPMMLKTAVFPLPGRGRTRFYVLTTSGILTAEASETALGEHRSQLSPLFFAGQQVITELRLITESRRDWRIFSPRRPPRHRS